MPFSKTELQEAIKNSHDTSPGPDNIHYQFLRHLPEISLQLLLHLLNNIWTSGDFPVGNRELSYLFRNPIKYIPIQTAIVPLPLPVVSVRQWSEWLMVDLYIILNPIMS